MPSVLIDLVGGNLAALTACPRELRGGGADFPVLTNGKACWGSKDPSGALGRVMMLIVFLIAHNIYCLDFVCQTVNNCFSITIPYCVSL